MKTNLRSSRKSSLLAVVTLATLSFGSLSAQAQSSAKEGLDKINVNLDNSKVNLAEYKKNLTIVEANMSEVAKAKAKVLEQQKSVNSQIESNNKSMAKITTQENELNRLMNEEKSKSTLEDKKIQELEALVAKIRETQKKREANVADYQMQMNQLQEEKKVWQGRAQTLKEQSQDVGQKVKTVSSEEMLWKNKQKGYQGEINRWGKELDRQQKIHDSYSSLAQGK